MPRQCEIAPLECYVALIWAGMA